MKKLPISFEFFPPQSEEGLEKLLLTRQKLDVYQPEYYSVTFGAGGSTRERTLDTVQKIRAQNVNAAPHLSCIGSTKQNIRDILNTYQSLGINRIVALRGDLPSGMVGVGEFQYANELVAFIRQETGDYFHLEVAAYPEYHPQSSSPQADILNFKRKVDAGANAAITQYFYNADSYFYFIDQCQKLGINIPIVPGIMPITRFSQLARFSDACGAEIPRWIRRTMESYGDDSDAIKAFGLEIVSALCERLIAGGAPGLHFYSMNQSAPTIAVLQAIDW